MLAVMSDEASFAPDLFRGTAGYYDEFRLLYPPTMLDDLTCRTAPSGRGRLLDLACGTGQLAFALRGSFAESWAVDQEPDMIEVVAAKALVVGAAAGGAAAGAGRVRAVVASAEGLDAPAGHFELIVIGNAFHRLRRDAVARLAYRWLAPGGFLALCWSSGPQAGSRDWQLAFSGVLRRWQAALDAGDRVPANWALARAERPDADVLSGAGFEPAGRFEFLVEHRWTLPELAGFARSLSVLPAAALANQGSAFDAELAAVLGPYVVDGGLTETVSFAYELGRTGVLPLQRGERYNGVT
jgi:SAM-dependent methyltransferase